MGSSSNKITGSYCYNKVLPLIDYCGDVRRKMASVNEGYEKNREFKYSPTYSPNNIKRLIISPDYVEVHYHIAIKNGIKFNRVQLSPQVLQKEEMMENYKPLMSVLYADRVCASIEEVILIANSNDGNVRLTDRDLDFASLVANYNGKNGSLEDSIKGRYKRLHNVSVINCSFNQFISMYKSADKTGFDFICDMDFMSSAQTKIFNCSDWYKCYGSAGQVYLMDKVGGDLNNYFRAVVEKKEREEKQRGIDAIKKERLAGIGEEMERLLSRYNTTVTCFNMLSKIAKVQGFNVLYNSNIPDKVSSINVISLNKCSVLKSYSMVEDFGLSDKDAIQKNIELLKQGYITNYTTVLNEFLERLLDLGRNNPITLKVVLKELNLSLMIPNNLSLLVRVSSEIEEISGITISNASFNHSLANLCMGYVMLFISSQGAKSIEKFLDKSYWLGVIQ